MDEGITPMALTTTIDTTNELFNLFREYGREKQFTYSALDTLHAYYSDLSEDIGEDIKLDVIAICCEWCEYESLAELAADYDGSWIDAEDIAVLEAGEDHADYADTSDRVRAEFHQNGFLLVTGIGSYLFSE